jgi:hypothetical protein
MTDKIRVYSLDDNDETHVSPRMLRYGDIEVAQWRKPRATIGELVVDIASPQGAHLATFDLADLIRVVKQQFPDELEKILEETQSVSPAEVDSDDAAFTELLRLNKKIQSLIDNAYTIANGDDDHSVWDDTFSRVFSDELRGRVREQFDALHLSFEWYDPDTTYKEDVTYYARDLKDRIEELKPQFPAVSSD